MPSPELTYLFRKWFEVLDKDRNGVIDVDEWVEAWMRVHTHLGQDSSTIENYEERLRTSFTHVDANKVI